jgi:endonuclease/exonuclease/phosphatase family metal-dependent hydrolase
MTKTLSLLFPVLLLLVFSCAPAVDDKTKVITDNEADTGRLNDLPSGQGLSIVFYNTENLYDTIDSPGTDDTEFTPEARIPWTAKRFNTKLDRLADVFSSVASPAMPDIIGLAEVENKFVLERLLKTGKMKSAAYGIVHFDSPDERGSDVALLYKKSSFDVVTAQPLKVKILNTGDRTRDILYVKGRTKSGEVLHLFVNHWPSRREGTELTEFKRIETAKTLRRQVDNILDTDPSARIVIMGDFNDEPGSRSIREVLSAKQPRPPYAPAELYNLLYDDFKAGKGTTYFKDWDMFDQLIVSGSLLKGSAGLRCTPESASIFSPDRLIHKDRNGKSRPNRTMGDKYFGGYSDHLPVVLKLEE